MYHITNFLEGIAFRVEDFLAPVARSIAKVVRRTWHWPAALFYEGVFALIAYSAFVTPPQPGVHFAPGVEVVLLALAIASLAVVMYSIGALAVIQEAKWHRPNSLWA